MVVGEWYSLRYLSSLDRIDSLSSMDSWLILLRTKEGEGVLLFKTFVDNLFWKRIVLLKSLFFKRIWGVKRVDLVNNIQPKYIKFNKEDALLA